MHGIKSKYRYKNFVGGDLSESVMKQALIIVDIKMCQKGVPTIGNPIFLNDKLCGYVINGGYSSVQGCGIGIGIIRLNQFMLLNKTNTRDTNKIKISPFWNYPDLRFDCYIKISV